MVGTDTFTPNLHLTKIGGDRKNWNDVANANMTSLDAVISAFFTVANMRGIWENSTAYAVGDAAVDPDTAVVWTNAVAHTSSMLPTTFAEARVANPAYWSVYSAPATNKGPWASGVSYSRNDFVLADGTKYAFCLVAHISGATFDADLALGYWSVLIDLGIVGSLVLPVLIGLADADKFVTVDGGGVSYVIVDAASARTKIGASAIGDPLITAASATAARTVIDAQEQTTLLDNYSAGLPVPTEQGGMPAGAVIPYAGGSAPTGYLFCDGASVTVAAYPDLHAVIGYSYGGAGANFNVPDLGGRVVAGKEAVATRLTNAISGVTGSTLGSAGGDQRMQAHTHNYTTTNGAGGVQFTFAGGALAFNNNAITTSTGAGASQNVQPTIVLNYIIKT